jgi:hypothetical protein
MTYSFKKMPPAEYDELVAKNLAYFKRKWGGEPDELFAKEFPEQMKVPYQEGFK